MPKKAQAVCVKGKVKWFNPRLGYGFIRQEDGKDVFVHYSSIQTPQPDGFRNLREGQEVEFELVENDRGPTAVNVVVLS